MRKYKIKIIPEGTIDCNEITTIEIKEVEENEKPILDKEVRVLTEEEVEKLIKILEDSDNFQTTIDKITP